ncbi:MAG: di-heme-cytochrome C peroxidase [Gammaproteobacteria bacterium]|nr:di-heme-cytochrome C peroxidase [Gammaproteobacteria bacterium]
MIRRFFCKLFFGIFLLLARYPKIIKYTLLLLFIAMPLLGLISTKTFQRWDDHPARGAVAINGGAMGESFQTPEYLDQGWDETDSLWFYNTTQGSGLLPYDFLIALEQPDLKDSTKFICERNYVENSWFLCDHNIDRFRYLPQTQSFFNPDALPVGFVKETYKARDYIGFTCAACHTGQVNFRNPGGDTPFALRIDGGPAMADMVGFLKELQYALEQSQTEPKKAKFIQVVLDLKNDYSSADAISNDLEKWTDVIRLYNTVNNSTYANKKVEYGHARLDAFGRIYNRVLQHVINKQQFAEILERLTSGAGNILVEPHQIDNVLAGINDTIIGDSEFAMVLKRLVMPNPDYPALSKTDLLRVRDAIFNRPNAPVSYPFLWDIAQSDYVQWNGLASNAGPGPLGRNAGEVIGVFGILDWSDKQSWFSKLIGFNLSSLVSGQANKSKKIRFDSSIDLFNLKRLESHLRSLTSPQWPFCKSQTSGDYYLPAAVKTDSPEQDSRPCADQDQKFDQELWKRGREIYGKSCQSCHELIDSRAWDRKVIANMSHLKLAGTDRAMADNSVSYKGNAGNFKHTYQTVDVGQVVVADDAPVIELLTAATRGVIATPDPDKWWPRRMIEWGYTLVMSIADNDIKPSIKRGIYNADTTAEPYASLLAYKARSLNGIWATAPYLHNGSVPDLYELLLPTRRNDDVDGERCEKYRRTEFVVGSREFDPVKVGFKSEGYAGFQFRTDIRGNRNTGHEYHTCKMTDQDRWALIEFLKSL